MILTTPKPQPRTDESVLKGIQIAYLIIRDDKNLKQASEIIGASSSHTATLMRRSLIMAYKRCDKSKATELDPHAGFGALRNQKDLWLSLLVIIEEEINKT